MIAPDETTFAYLEGRPYAPTGEAWDAAVADWRTLPSDPDAVFDREVAIDVGKIAPQITWGTSPEHVVGVDGRIPDPATVADADRRNALQAALDYMDLKAGAPIAGTPVDWVFIGSCTNSRISDLRAAAAVANGRKVAGSVRAWIVPGSENVKRQAEAEGSGPGVQVGRLRVARARLLDVPRHEQRDGAAGPAQRLHLQPQLRRPPGAGRAHASGQPRHGRRGRARRAHRRRAHDLTRQRNIGRQRRARSIDMMEAFTVLEGIAAPLLRPNINTDIIIRIERLRDFEGAKLGPYCFESWRYRRDGSEDPAFVLNKPPYRDARIMIGGENFACGSSREAAVWALKAFGIRCVIAPSFGSIFFSNCFQNGVLPVIVPAKVVEDLAAEVEADPGQGQGHHRSQALRGGLAQRQGDALHHRRPAARGHARGPRPDRADACARAADRRLPGPRSRAPSLALFAASPRFGRLSAIRRSPSPQSPIPECTIASAA